MICSMAITLLRYLTEMGFTDAVINAQVHHITSDHITSHHITSHHITSHHITSHPTCPQAQRLKGMMDAWPPVKTVDMDHATKYVCCMSPCTHCTYSTDRLLLRCPRPAPPPGQVRAHAHAHTSHYITSHHTDAAAHATADKADDVDDMFDFLDDDDAPGMRLPSYAHEL